MTQVRWAPLRTYLIEAQKIFVPAISAILLDAGLEIVYSADRLDFRTIVNVSPDVVFADLDFFQTDPNQSIQIMRTLLPEGIICIYTLHGDVQQDAYRACGADAVFSKSISRRELVRSIQQVIATSNGSHVV